MLKIRMENEKKCLFFNSYWGTKIKERHVYSENKIVQPSIFTSKKKTVERLHNVIYSELISLKANR